MADNIKIRAQLNGDITELRVLMQHPMETGQRRDENGLKVAAHFIQAFTVLHNGTTLVSGQLNTSISRNPLFTFRTRGVKSGDRIAVTWTDNTGTNRQDEIIVG